ncbi:helix-turn-helix domain-containing protein [Lentzea sp. NPDC051208]|uniref:helix-turn-helix domain-containing protein n=1 Tax=Lentzea sp. NPDC051208 TaxID=3154642 RepID=UPI003442F9D6
MSQNKNVSTLHKPSEVAKHLGCSEWWVKEQARRRRIPFSWIGGRYLFTDAHIDEIVLICEKRPISAAATVAVPQEVPCGNRTPVGGPVVRLRSRSPRRALAAETRSTAA